MPMTQYKPVPRGEDQKSNGEDEVANEALNRGEKGEHHHEFSWGRIWCAPLCLLFIGSLVALSQMQLAFGTKYFYDYRVRGVTEGAEGETYTYSLWHGIMNLYEQGAKELALVVFFWSGVFPFLKLILIGVVDVIGRRQFAKGAGGASRSWGILSVLAKWSFLDVWVVAITCLVVRIDIDKSQTLRAAWGIVPLSLYLQIWTQAYALPGVYYFGAALVFSQFVGHFVLQRAIYGKHPSVKERANVPRTVAGFRSYLLGTEGGETLMARTPGTLVSKIILGSCCCFSFLGLSAGLWLPFLHLEYHFRLHVEQFSINEHVDADIIKTYTVLQAVNEIGAANHGIGQENQGLAFLVVSFVVFAPLARSLSCLILWFFPLSDSGHRVLAGVIDVLSVVAAADCFGCSAALMIWQLPKLFAQMEEAAKYLSLELTPLSGLYIFTLFGFIDTFVASTVHHRYMAALREEHADGEAPHGETDLEAGRDRANQKEQAESK